MPSRDPTIIQLQPRRSINQSIWGKMQFAILAQRRRDNKFGEPFWWRDFAKGSSRGEDSELTSEREMWYELKYIFNLK